MTRAREKEANVEKDSDTLLNVLPKEELVKLSRKLVLFLKKKYHLSVQDILESGDTDILIPVTIFSTDLSPSESITRYLKDTYDLGFSEIAGFLKKETSSIWSSYQRSLKKAKDFKYPDSDIFVPITIFKEKLSILESLILYLKDSRKLRVPKLVKVLKKNSSTLWTAYNRAKKKLGGKK